MKTIYTLMLVFALGTTLNCNAQDTPVETLLTETWTFDYTTSIAHLAPNKKELFDAFTPDILTNIEKAYVNRTLTFDPSGAFEQTSQDGRSTKGTWNYLTDQSVIQMTNDTGALLELIVVKITVNSLLLTPIENGETTLLMNQWYFTKL